MAGYSRQQGGGAGKFVEQRSANNEAVDAAMRGIEPTETPGVFRGALEAERGRRLEDIIMNTQGAQAESLTSSKSRSERHDPPPPPHLSGRPRRGDAREFLARAIRGSGRWQDRLQQHKARAGMELVHHGSRPFARHREERHGGQPRDAMREFREAWDRYREWLGDERWLEWIEHMAMVTERSRRWKRQRAGEEPGGY